MSPTAPRRLRIAKALKSGRSLILISVLLPSLLFALAGWQNRREVLREAATRVDKTVRILHEHSIKVFETHRLVVDQVNERLRTIDWTNEAEQSSLHELLRRLQESLDQVATITITDADGRMRASSRTYPANPSVSFADRDWFQALKERKTERLFVSRSYTGRQSGQSVFNVADRVFSADGTFQGAIAISVDRAYFESFYSNVEPGIGHSVFLVRTDGTYLARVPQTDENAIPPDAPLMQAVQRARNSGMFEAASRTDGVERIVGYVRVSPYPVFVGFGVSKQSVLAEWRSHLLAYGVIALLSSLALLGVSGLAIREASRERLASQRWQEAAAQARAEVAQREQAEEQLRQAQKMEAVGRLTGGVAHDFNNLLTVITGSLDILRRHLSGADERSLKLLNNALEGANRAASLTHRLLAFSRQQPLEPKAIDPNKLMAGMSEMLSRTLSENIAIETVLAGGLWRTFADPNQLESAILNLAVNARDAMPDGGKLTIETANAHLDDAYARAHSDVKAGQYVLIAVCDTGAGMPPDVAARAFDPFFTTKAVGRGTGLGLSQVYGFAKQSGGHVAIYSEPGQGTTVKLYLQRIRQAEKETQVDQPAIESVPSTAMGETILIVEDEEIVRQFTASALREAGYEVLEASDGPSGIKLVRSHPAISLLFTDVVLAGPTNGRQVADEALKLRPDIEVLFTTGYTRNAIIHHGRLDEDINFIGKPFTAPALLAKIRSLLDT